MSLGPTGKVLERKTPAEDELIASGQFTWQQLRRMAIFIRERLNANGTLLRFSIDLDLATERWLHGNLDYMRSLRAQEKPETAMTLRDPDYEPNCIYCRERYRT